MPPTTWSCTTSTTGTDCYTTAMPMYQLNATGFTICGIGLGLLVGLIVAKR